MSPQPEPQLQAIVRRVAAKLLRSTDAASLAEKLEQGDPHALGELRPLIADARKEWEKEYKVVALHHEGLLWEVTPVFPDEGADGPLVLLYWGWDTDTPKVTTSGESAFDLALEILQHFTNEDGELERPEQPEASEPSEEVSRFYSEFTSVAQEYMDITGEHGSCSFLDVSLWSQLGKPRKILEHDWEEYPEDEVCICSACHHWFSTAPDSDDFPLRVCPGKPLQDPRILTTEQFDPRRSPALREAQRLDKLVHYMKQAEATTAELEPMIDALAHHKNQLTEEELERYDNERVGL